MKTLYPQSFTNVLANHLKRTVAVLFMVTLAWLLPVQLHAQAPAITSFTPLSGPVGTLVTITGSSLSSPTAFTIGGKAAIVVSNNGSTLVGMVMPGAVTGAVSVTTAGGGVTGSSNFTVTATQFPAVQQGAKLQGSDALGTASQGSSVSVSADGNTAIVGGNNNTGGGAAWVYIRSGGVWTQQGARLTPSDMVGAGLFGTSAAISADGNTAVIGGSNDNGNTGAVWIFIRSGSVWSQQGSKLVAGDAIGNAIFGNSVSISADGNTIVVGGRNDNSQVGATWIFARSGGVWAEQAKLVGSDNIGASQQGAFVRISADGKTAISGGNADNGDQGAAWIFINNGGVWTEQAKLVGTGNIGVAAQGNSVALSADGNTALSGGTADNSSRGAAWIFTRAAGVWTQQAKLVSTAAGGSSLYGRSAGLSADGNTAIIGAPSNSVLGIFTRSGVTWTQQRSGLGGVGTTSTSNMGKTSTLSADGTTAIAGGPTDASGVGSAWIFTTVAAAKPATQASNVAFTATTATTTTASWTNGNGMARAVFMAAASSGSPAPVDLTAYNANAAFGSGDQIGASGWYCVYNGTGSTVNITGLTALTTYQLMVVEYNGAVGNVAYQTNTGAGNPAGVTTLSSDALLANLTISNGILSPGFSSSTITYADAIANFTSGITVVPTTDDPNATLTINGNHATPGVRSASIPMSVGPNTLTIVVTAQDGVTTKTYTINITRGLPNNALLSSLQLNPTSNLLAATGSGNFNYTATVPNSEGTLQVTPTLQDPAATVMVNGTAVTSGSASLPISLNEGANTITTQVTAQDGTTTRTYVIIIKRLPAPPPTQSHNATLASVKLNPTSNLLLGTGPGYLNLTATVPNNQAAVQVVPTVLDATATVTVNSQAATSGTATDPINLSVGSNTITVEVTAQDGTTIRDYIITLTRLSPTLSNNAQVATLTTLPKLTLIGTTGPGYLNFWANVRNNISSIQELVTTKDPNAILVINGLAATSGTASDPITLNVGSNTITTVITAQDGVTQKTVILTINRAAPASDNSVFNGELSMNKPTDNIPVNDDGIIVHQAVSPNGDGVNDILTIENINNYPTNHLTIIDRNGLMIYEAKGYNNATKPFDGRAANGKMQLPGTYFYSLDYTVNGENRHKTGFIVLKY